MSVTVKLVHRTSKQRKDGTCPVWIRITAERKSTFKSTGIAVLEKHWDADRQVVRRSHPIAPALNRKLKEVLLKTQAKALDASSAQAVKASIGAVGGSFTAHYRAFIDDLEADRDRFWDWKKHKVTLGKLQKCFSSEIDWKEIDKSALRKFERCLRIDYENGAATTQKEMQRLSRVFKNAVNDDVIPLEANPFLKYQIPKGSAPNRRKLTIEEIESIEQLDLSFGTPLRTARDVFLTAFYCGGMRFGDVARLRPSQLKNGRVEYRMLKTDKPISNPIPDRLLPILAPYLKEDVAYVFSLLKEGDESDPVHLRRRINSNNVVVNRYLKTVAEMAGIEPETFTMHVARHSFADYARRKSGGNLYAISKTLGHTKLSTTQVYLSSLDQEAVDQLAEQIWR